MEVPRLRERARTLARLEGFLPVRARRDPLNGEPGVAQTAAVTPGLLPMMAAPIEQGRSFLPGEGEPGHFVAVITDRYWRDTLGSGSVLGTPLVIDGQPHTIVGILAPSFAVPFLDAHIFTPLVRESRAAAARAAAFGGRPRRARAGRIDRAGARRARHDLPRSWRRSFRGRTPAGRSARRPRASGSTDRCARRC